MSEPLRTVAIYTPPAVARATLATKNPVPPSDCQHERFEAAVLFADVSGFTPLTEALAQKGSEGPEELTRLLNRYFSWMIAFIEAEGGEVVKFGGDALTVVFRAEGEPIANATRRALQAAKTMQSAMEEFGIMESSVGLISLRMKFGIGAGQVIAAHIGGISDRWEYLIGGDALVQAALSERQAQQGEIILSTQAQAVIHPQELLARPLSLINWKGVHNPAAVEAVLRCYVPKPIQTWLDEELHSWLATLRPMSVLFAGFKELDYDKPGTIEQLHQFVRSAQKIVYHYEGSLPRIMVDEKGTVLLIIFGAPPSSHEDDPERAVRCALDLQAVAHQQNLQLSIGVTTGRVFAGPVGGFTRREYTVMGDTVNLAARLMVMAGPGQVRCNYEAFRSTYGQIGFESLPPIKVKGKVEPIRIYCPTGDYRPGQQLERIRQADIPLIGRHPEMDRLISHLKAVQSRQSRIVIIEGEAGIGKTQVVKELVNLAQQQQTTVLLGVGRSIDQSTPYRVWHEIINNYLGGGNESKETLAELIWNKISALDPYLEDYLFLLNDMLGTDVPEGAVAALLDENGRYQMLASIVLTLLDAGAMDRSLILILEDAQWLDPYSWALAVQMALTITENQLRVMLMLVTRPFENRDTRGDLATLAQMPQADRLRLDTLPADDILALVAAPLGLTSNELPEAVAELIRHRAGGNPFFAEEIFYFLHQNRYITFKAIQDKTRCLVSGDLNRTAQTLPATIQNVILSRIDLLPPEKQLMLRVAAVIGQSFVYVTLRDTLRQHLEIAEPQIRADLDDLTYLGFIVPDPDAPDLSYRFKHIIIREVAYQTLLFDRRRKLHRTVAEWYENVSNTKFARQIVAINPGTTPGLTVTRSLPPASTPLVPFYTLLVYHWHQAEDESKERHYATLVGEQAVRLYANAEALSYLSRALDLTPENDLEPRFKLLLARETVLSRRGVREQQALDLTRLAQVAQLAQKPVWETEASLRYANFASTTGRYSAALEAVKGAIAGVSETTTPTLVGKCLVQWARILLKTGHFNEARQKLQQLNEIPHTDETVSIEAAGQICHAYLDWHAGNYTQARKDGRSALAFANIYGEKLEAADCHNLLGQIDLKLGKFEAAAKHFDQAEAAYYAVGYRQGEALSMHNIGLVHFFQGNFEAARDYFEQALDLAKDLDDRANLAKSMASLGDLNCSLGDYTSALGYLGQALGIQKEIEDQLGEAEVLGKLSRIYVNIGDHRTAKRYCELALTIQHAIDAPDGQSYTLTYLGRVLAGLGEWDKAAVVYQNALEMRKKMRQTYAAVPLKAGLATVYLTQDKPEAALELAGQATAWLANNKIWGIEDFCWVYLSLYEIFRNRQQVQQAQALIDQAYKLVQALAGKLSHPKVRHKFLEHVKTNQKIVSIWHRKKTQPPRSAPKNGRTTQEVFYDDGSQPG